MTKRSVFLKESLQEFSTSQIRMSLSIRTLLIQCALCRALIFKNKGSNEERTLFLFHDICVVRKVNQEVSVPYFVYIFHV